MRNYQFPRKIPVEDREKIRQRYFSGESSVSIAEDYGVDHSSILYHCNGRRVPKLLKIKKKVGRKFKRPINFTKMCLMCSTGFNPERWKTKLCSKECVGRYSGRHKSKVVRDSKKGKTFGEMVFKKYGLNRGKLTYKEYLNISKKEKFDREFNRLISKGLKR